MHMRHTKQFSLQTNDNGVWTQIKNNIRYQNHIFVMYDVTETYKAVNYKKLYSLWNIRMSLKNEVFFHIHVMNKNGN